MTKSVLVIFTGDLPKKNQKWWRQFEAVVAPKSLKDTIEKHGLHLVDLETLVDTGSVEEASALVRKLSLLTDSSDRRISKIVNFKGFELWWMNYDSLMYKFCLPYTEYRRLLEYLKDFSYIHLYEPPNLSLFKHFLDAYECKYSVKVDSRFERKLPLGILLQVALSIPFLLWLKLRGPKLMLWTSDRFDPPRDHNFRMKFIYEELWKRKINFAEFIRSMEPSSVVLRHALKRRRPVIYSYAIATFSRVLGGIFNKSASFRISSDSTTEEKFMFNAATHYVKNFKSDIWAIKTIKFILGFIGIKSAIIVGAINRNFPEVLACKLLDIPIVGIQHGLHPKSYFVSDFMHEFDGERNLSVDKYGLWSEWWREYYTKNSRAYKPEQLYVSGLMRPLEKSKRSDLNTGSKGLTLNSRPIKVLFVAEELAAPSEVLPYLEALMKDQDLSLYIKFRPYRDGFEEWLNENRPSLLDNFDKTKILKVSMNEAIDGVDVVVGSHSAGVLESVLQLKPFVLFWTNKWRDFFDLKPNYSQYGIFVETPADLICRVKDIKILPQNILKKLQEDFFGDPYRNGSSWVVDQAEAVLKGCVTK